MKKINLIIGLLCMMWVAPMFTSCDDDDDFSYYTDMATVAEEDGQWVLNSDNGGKLIPEDASLIKANQAEKDGQRVIAAFNFTDDRNGNRVKLYDVYRVLTKDAFQMTEADEDSIGNDPIAITRIFASADHINIRFIYEGNVSGIKHFINLVTTEQSTIDSKGLLYMELRHNNEGDHPRFTQAGWVAFPLKSIPGFTEGKIKGLRIKTNKGDGNEETIAYTFPTKEDNGQTKLNKDNTELSISSFSNTETK